MAVTLDGSTDFYEATSWSEITAAPCTISAWFRPTTVPNATKSTCQIGTDSDNHRIANWWVGNGTTFGTRYNVKSTSAVNINGGQGWSNATWHSAVVIYAAANSHTSIGDVSVAGTSSTSKTPSGIDRIAIGATTRAAGRLLWAGDIAEVAVWNRALSNAEAFALGQGASPLHFAGGLRVYVPFRSGAEADDHIGIASWTKNGTPVAGTHPRIIYPAPVFYSFPAAVAGGATVDVPAGTLTITGQVPSVSTGVQVSAPVGSLTIQGYVPAIQTGVSVAVPAGSLAITGQVPSISTGVSVAVPAGTLTITGQVPVITAGGVIANVPAGSLAITGQVPTVSTGVSVAVPAGALTIQGYVPTLSMGVQVSVPAGALAIQGYVPAIQTGVSVAVPAGSLAITGQVPTVTAGAVATTVSVPVGTLTITGYAPLVTSYLRSGLLAQIHTDIDGYLNTYDNLSKIVTHNAVDYRGVFTDVSAIGLQGGTNARDGPWVVMKSDDVDGTISYGDTVTIYSRDWTVEGIQPDGTGTTRLILIPAA